VYVARVEDIESVSFLWRNFVHTSFLLDQDMGGGNWFQDIGFCCFVSYACFRSRSAKQSGYVVQRSSLTYSERQFSSELPDSRLSNMT
jgi:hypothetical protein